MIDSWRLWLCEHPHFSMTIIEPVMFPNLDLGTWRLEIGLRFQPTET
ncbi:hypothetical protein [Chamaesiphon sp. GL140_3_metabinner_50]|nr:hypothetical protein [Chamaesiphon sp. GL140_3_metabinner_50]